MKLAAFIKRNIALALVLMLAATAVVPVIVPAQQADALSGVDFNASRIIDDSVFFNASTQDITDIQNFLNAKMPSCDTNGTKPSGRSGYPTRADWARANGVSGPFTCLRDYSQSFGSTSGDAYCGAIAGGNKSAANIIYDVARACSVNSQVLIVLLQKEQSLVTDDWPWPTQYRSATGYGCPDTAACDSAYYGFFNQVYNAARQFKRYAAMPQNYNYASGRTSFVAYQANRPDCSGTNLTLQNSPTAALYNYTPYQPNPAALNNLYGTGDGCSAYGNRNFWRMFNDWFGPTLGDLVRTPDNATVYLVSGTNKYPIGDMSVFSDYSSLGPVRYVTNEYLGSKTAGQALGHMVGSAGGTLYFVNAGIKLPFSSCGQVEQFGYSCGSIIYLSDGQLGRLANGPYITQRYGTTTGKQFYISGGQKREVFDNQSLTDAGISMGANTLLEEGIGYLPYGSPIVRNGVTVTDRSNGDRYLYDMNRYFSLNGDMGALRPVDGLGKSGLDSPSIPAGQKVGAFSALVEDNSAANQYAIVNSGKVKLTNPSNWTNSFTKLSDTTLSALGTSSEPLNNQLVKSATDGTVYYVLNGQKRPIPGWDDLTGLNITPFVINTVPSALLNKISTGPMIYAPGRLVKTANSGTVYVVRNSAELFPISSFTFPQELGVGASLVTITQGDFNSFTVSSLALRTKVKCGSNYYVGIRGVSYAFTAPLMTAYGFNSAEFIDGSSMCANMPLASKTLGSFIRVDNGTIFEVSGGQKHPISSYAAYLARGGTADNTISVSDYFAGLVPNGSTISN